MEDEDIWKVNMEHWSRWNWLNIYIPLIEDVGIVAALILCLFIQKNKDLEEASDFGIFILCKRKEIELRTSYNTNQQRKAEKILVKKKLITIKYLGNPPKKHYLLKMNELQDYFTKLEFLRGCK